MGMVELEKKVTELIDEFHGSLPAGQSHDLKLLPAAGEPGIAFEILCEQLIEYDVAVTRAQQERFRQVGMAMGIDSNYWDQLAKSNS